MKALVVKTPFADYAVGEFIIDADKVAEFNDSSHVVRIEIDAPAKLPPAPAPQSKDN